MLSTFEKDTIALLCSALRNRATAVSADYNVGALCTLAKEHRVLNIALYGLLASGIDQSRPEVQRLFFDATREVFVHENQMAALKKVLCAFEENGIDHLPFKGVRMKALYPKPEMRSMSDADILIREEQYGRIREVLPSLGFTETDESDHEYIWKSGMVTLELHKRPIPSYDTDYGTYFGDGWQRAVPADRPHAYRMTDEDTFLYLFTHFAKHYRDGGIGVGHLADLWVYLCRYPAMQQDTVETVLEEMGLLTFYRHVRQTLQVWFEGAEPTAEAELITRTVLRSGAYGTREDHLRAAALRERTAKGKENSTTRLSMLRRILFPGYKEMCTRYAFVKRGKWLLPFSWPVLWVDALLHKHKSIARRQADLQAVSAEQLDAHERELQAVGLSFDLKR